MVYSCFAIGVLILAAALVWAIKDRHNTKKWIAHITVGIFFSTAVMALPTAWIKEGQTISAPILYRITASLIYSFKVIGGRPELAQLETVPLEGWQKAIYVGMNLLAFIAAPILASSLILSFFGDTMERVKYWLRLSPKCCIFSELNENSLTLAKSMKQEKGRETIVFCNTKDSDAGLIERARKMGGILLFKPCKALLPFRRKQTAYELYLIAEDKDQNVSDAEAVLDKKNAMADVDVKTIVFTQDEMSIAILEDMAKSDKDETDGIKFKMSFIDEIALFCNDLVFRHPLYDLPDGRKDISVMIIGCGTWGSQMLKTVLSSGQISGYHLKICVYDNRAEYLKHLFFFRCPEVKKLLTEYKKNVQLSFVQTDVLSDSFFEKIEENANADATYVCVATSMDNVNLTVAEKLYCFFRRKNGFSYTPPIFARVNNNVLTENFSCKSESYLQKRGIELFGTAASFYAQKTLFNTTLEQLALGAHLVYCTDLGEESLLTRHIRYLKAAESGKGKEAPQEDEKYKEAIRSFYAYEGNRQSSMAAVLHFGAKIMSVCGEMTESGKISKDVLAQYKKAMQNPREQDRLTKNEHDRWNFFTASNGWQRIKPEEIIKYYPTSGKHKDDLSKTHPCLTAFNKLDSLSKTYNALKPAKERDFLKEDQKIVLALPEIVSFANGYKGEDEQNVSAEAGRNILHRIARWFSGADGKNC